MADSATGTTRSKALVIAGAVVALATVGGVAYALGASSSRESKPPSTASTSTSAPSTTSSSTTTTVAPTTTTVAPVPTAPPQTAAPATTPPTTAKTLIDIIVKQVSYNEQVLVRDLNTGLPTSIKRTYGCERTYKYSDYSSRTEFKYQSTPCA